VRLRGWGGKNQVREGGVVVNESRGGEGRWKEMRVKIRQGGRKLEYRGRGEEPGEGQEG